MKDENRPLRLWIQINCLNEEESLRSALEDLPKRVSGIDKIEVLIVDDGSRDSTVQVAKDFGVKHIVSHSKNRGLPQAVNTGMLYALQNGADILVNTDADGQYKGEDIAKLVEPIIKSQADFVYGERQIDSIAHFSWTKKRLQKMGAAVVSWITGMKLIDAASGFRAMNREAFSRLYLLSDYASPLETLIQARMKNLGVEKVEILTRPTSRPSRLFKSKFKYVFRSAIIILDNLFIYYPLQVFASLGSIFLLFGLGITMFRLFLVREMATGDHLTLMIFAILFFVLGGQMFFFGLSARLQRANRLISEEQFYRQNKSI